MIHVKDIIAIIKIAMSEEKHKSFKGERFIVSSGAYRICDLAKAAGIASPPEILPLDNDGNISAIYSFSKILSSAKLLQVIGLDYIFTPILPDAEPASCGLPSALLPSSKQPKYSPTPLAHDRQWDLVRSINAGRWIGDGYYYTRKDEDLATYATGLNNEDLPAPDTGLNNEDLPAPDIYKNILYNVAYTDHDSGIWHGVSKRELKFPFSRITFNSSDKSRSFSFPILCGTAQTKLQLYAK